MGSLSLSAVCVCVCVCVFCVLCLLSCVLCLCLCLHGCVTCMRMLGYMCSLAACHSCGHKGQGVVVHNAEFDRTAIHCTTAWVHASCGVTAVWVPTELASRIEIVNGEANLRPSARPERAVTPTRSRSRSRSRSHRGHRAGTQGYCFALPCAWWDSVARGVPCTTNWVALCGAAEFMRVTWCREGGGGVHAHGRGPLSLLVRAGNYLCSYVRCFPAHTLATPLLLSCAAL
jgi:hypothetical protein